MAARTIKERIKKGYGNQNILRRSGHLARSINYRASSDQVIVSMGGVGNSLDYAAAHQFGAIINMRPRRQTLYYQGNGNRWVSRRQSDSSRTVNVGGYTIRIPARPVIGLSVEDKGAVNTIFENFLAED
ncbi:hypothetical protein C4J81_10110 [Deltaproteobacteria bacterium Smac51]|nr:hypothetical protein C4J81_10110 [Deltaproteobacteria bacterium Smac51]